MFDNIIVKQNLPIPEDLKHLNIDWEKYNFQTKDLHNCLLDYWVSEEGELFEHIVEKEYIPYSEEEYKKHKKHKKWNLWKDVIEKGSRDEKLNHHGVLKIYTYDELDKNTDFWLEFKLYFTYGKLDKIELTEFNIDINRKIYNKEWEEKYKKRAKHPWNVFKRYASYLGWSWFWRKLSIFLYKVSSVAEKIRMLILKHLI